MYHKEARIKSSKYGTSHGQDREQYNQSIQLEVNEQVLLEDP
jgi:hypothetical protein